MFAFTLSDLPDRDEEDDDVGDGMGRWILFGLSVFSLLLRLFAGSASLSARGD